MQNDFFNIKECKLILNTNVPGYTSFDALQNGGLDSEATIDIKFASDTVTRKQDAVSGYTQYSRKNDKSCDLEIGAIQNGPFHKWIDGLQDIIDNSGISVEMTGSLFNPSMGKNIYWSGTLNGRPPVQWQGDLPTIKAMLIGTASIVPQGL